MSRKINQEYIYHVSFMNISDKAIVITACNLYTRIFETLTTEKRKLSNKKVEVLMARLIALIHKRTILTSPEFSPTCQ